MADWWGGEDSGDDSDLYSTDEEDDNMPKQRIVYALDDSSSDDGEKRVVKSKKESAFDDLQKAVDVINKKIAINDWVAISTEWSELEKLLSKKKGIITEAGLPRFYIAFLVSFQDFIEKTNEDKAVKKAMKSQNAKSFNKMRQAMRKYVSANKWNVGSLMEAYDPDELVEEEDEEEDPDFWLDEEDELESSTSEEEEDVWVRGEKRDISYWYTPDKPKKEKSEKVRKPRGPKVRATKSKATVGDTEKADEEWDQAQVDQKVRMLMSKRGAKNYNRAASLRELDFLFTKSEGIQNEISIKFHKVTLLLDNTRAGKANYLPIPSWKQVYNLLVELIGLLVENKDITLYENAVDLQKVIGEDVVAPLPPTAALGFLSASIELLKDELVKSLQSLQAHTQAYVQRLSHEQALLNLCYYAQSYYESKNMPVKATLMKFHQLEHLYYRRASDDNNWEIDDLAQKDDGEESDDEEAPPKEEDELAVLPNLDTTVVADNIFLVHPPEPLKIDDLMALVESLARSVYRSGIDKRYRRKAMLYHIFFLAAHDRFFEARDMLLMSHLNDKIHKAKPAIQILFNRLTVQLGLSAFRLGRVKDCHRFLTEISASGRSKELLAQGVLYRQNMNDRTALQEKAERALLLPYHMHLNLDLIETCHLICGLILELPNDALKDQRAFRGEKPRVISKSFKRALDIHGRQIFLAEPENTRESIIVAAEKLSQGDWEQGLKYIEALSSWKLLPGGEEIFAFYKMELKKAGMLSYVFKYVQSFRNSKYILFGEIPAALDQASGTLVVNPGSARPSETHRQALQYAERINYLLDVEVASEEKRRTEQYSRFGEYNRQSYAPRYQRNTAGGSSRKAPTRR